MTGVIIVGLCIILLLGLLILLLKSCARFRKIDEKYGKPYKAKIVKMIGGHPELKRGSMAISFHPNDAIAFNRKVFQFSEISAIKIISELPEKLSDGGTVVNSEAEEQYLYLAVTDESGEHEVVFTAKLDFKEIANQLIQKWNKYNLLS